MTKTRIIIQVAKSQLDALKKRQQETGASMAEICRRAIDLYLKSKKGNS